MNAEHISTGFLGERIAEKFLKSKGFKILERNYRVGYGEIDIIAVNEATTCFVEVKTVTRETESGSSLEFSHRPEEKMHPQKIKILLRTIERYLMDKADDTDWQLDLVVVELHVKQRMAVVRHIESVC